MSARLTSKIIAVSLLAAVVAWSAEAQAGQATLGNGYYRLSDPAPLASNSSNRASAMGVLYTKDELVELPADGVLTALELSKIDIGATTAQVGNFKIYLANTSATSLPEQTLATLIAGATLVYSSTTQGFPAQEGWVAPGALNGSPFTYTGNGLVVIYVWDGTAFTDPATQYGLQGFSGEKAIWFGNAPGSASNTVIRLAKTSAVQDGDMLVYGSVERPALRLTYSPGTGTKALLVRANGRYNVPPGTTRTVNGAFAPGVAVPQYFTVTNLGDTTVNISGVSVTGANNVSVLVTQDLPATLAPGASAELVVTQTAASTGSADYMLNIASDAPGSPYSFTTSGSVATSGTATVGVQLVDPQGRRASGGGYFFRSIGVSHSFQMLYTNLGSAPATLSGSPKVDVPSANLVNAVVNCTQPSAATIDPWKELLVDCTLTVPAEGKFGARVALAFTGGTTSPSTFVLDGMGVTQVLPSTPDMTTAAPDMAVPDLSTPPETLDDLAAPDLGAATPAPEIEVKVWAFGAGAEYWRLVGRDESIAVGWPIKPVEMEIVNLGDVDLHVASITIDQMVNCAASTDDPFGNPAAPVTIKPGYPNSRHVQVTVTPTTKAPISFRLTLASDDPDENPLVFTITARPGPILYASWQSPSDPMAAEISSQKGQTTKFMATLANIGTETLVISDVFLDKTVNCAARIESGPNKTNIPPGGGTTVYLEVAGTGAEGPFSFSLMTDSNDEANPHDELPLSGTAKNVGGRSSCTIGGAGDGGALPLLILALAIARRHRLRRAPVVE